jgi:TonB family protein
MGVGNRSHRGWLISGMIFLSTARAVGGERAPDHQPIPTADAETRVWARLDAAATQAVQSRAKPRAHPIAIAEIAYPRSREESDAFGGQALVLVTAMTAKRSDLAAVRVTSRTPDGAETDLVRVTGQTNYVGDRDSVAIKAFGMHRYDGLFFISPPITEQVGDLLVTFADPSERVVVLKFSKRRATDRGRWPKPDAGANRVAAGRVAATKYPFFRVPPLHSPANDAACASAEPPVEDAARTPPSSRSLPPLTPRLVLPAPGILSMKTAPATHAAPGLAGPDASDWSPRTRGSLEKEMIRAEIRTHVDEVRSCYEEGLEIDRELKGRVMVQFTIAADGTVIASTLQSSTIGGKSVNECIVAVVRCWRFPSPLGGGLVIVSYPFVLTPADNDGPP